MSVVRCGRCNRILKTVECVQMGFGRVCYRKAFGASFPHKERVPRSSQSIVHPRIAKRAKHEKGEAQPLFAMDIVCRRTSTGEASANVPRRVVHHSPDGYEWGYGGSGPADLALNILSLFVGANRAWPLHQEFKSDFIANMPHEGGTIPKDAIVNWIEAHEARE